jgi:hypothetical protein
VRLANSEEHDDGAYHRLCNAFNFWQAIALQRDQMRCAGTERAAIMEVSSQTTKPHETCRKALARSRFGWTPIGAGLFLRAHGEKDMKVSFAQLFEDKGNGMYAPKGRIKIGAATLTPGISFRPGVSFSGVDVGTLVGKDFEVTYHPDGLIEVTGTY